ncbi:hypothetical protein [Desulforamulus aquiferis]|uniref:YqzN/YkzM domain-containing protein n=1 Tax=Desulforamulus aquiferis TaxID=1397668 RepID=A0AAW7ZBR8_9FIRM|nr:hypothetical protein [Desulforamulus aquiferis]MDO7787127.1 hypothetical protein [Desulforamulus aquiferis]
MDKEPKFDIASLRKHCKELFGVQPEVFDGAFHFVKGEFTKAEANRKIKDFLKKEVK